MHYLQYKRFIMICALIYFLNFFLIYIFNINIIMLVSMYTIVNLDLAIWIICEVGN